MAEITLAAEVGRPLGSSAARRLRRDGRIPAVVYGHGAEPVSVSVIARDLRTALSSEAGTNALLSLHAGKKTYLTLARELQRHPVSGTLLHVDFQIVRRDEVIAAEVPISLVGEAVEVHHGDGLVDQQLFSLTVRAKPADIPSVIEVDVSGLTLGAAIRLADISLPPGVSPDADADTALVVGQPPRVAAAAEAGEGEPTEEAPAASAPADGAAEGAPGSEG